MTDLAMDLTIALQRYRDERYRRLMSTDELNELIDRLAGPECWPSRTEAAPFPDSLDGITPA
jgi:hypothetical protein